MECHNTTTIPDGNSGNDAENDRSLVRSTYETTNEDQGAVSEEDDSSTPGSDDHAATPALATTPVPDNVPNPEETIFISSWPASPDDP